MKELIIAAMLLIITVAWISGSQAGQAISKAACPHDANRQTYPTNPQLGDSGREAIVFRPIGVFHSPYTRATGAPRQGILQPETRATIEIDELYRKGLTDLEKFEYIIVLYYFDGIKKWSPMATPPKSKHTFGFFATRSPRRPNPIGFSVIRLNSVDMEKGLLHVSGIDAFDGTPVLDIKPYIPAIDMVKSEKNRNMEHRLGMHQQDRK